MVTLFAFFHPQMFWYWPALVFVFIFVFFAAINKQYEVELPGPILVGEGKPNNQNHAIIFTRGEAVQAIDMNQDGGIVRIR